MEKKRLTFKCWHCDREYSLTRELEGKAQLIVACPFCDKEGVADLAPWRSKTITVLKGEAETTETLDLPAVLPTQPAPLQPAEQ